MEESESDSESDLESIRMKEVRRDLEQTRAKLNELRKLKAEQGL